MQLHVNLDYPIDFGISMSFKYQCCYHCYQKTHNQFNSVTVPTAWLCTSSGLIYQVWRGCALLCSCGRLRPTRTQWTWTISSSWGSYRATLGAHVENNFRVHAPLSAPCTFSVNVPVSYRVKGRFRGCDFIHGRNDIVFLTCFSVAQCRILVPFRRQCHCLLGSLLGWNVLGTQFTRELIRIWSLRSCDCLRIMGARRCRSARAHKSGAAIFVTAWVIRHAVNNVVGRSSLHV